MKLRNKKTGEIAEFRYLQSDYVASLVLTTNENGKPMMYSYNSLAELNEEWEDVPEEPSKTIWQIKDSGELQDFEEDDFSDGYIESSKSIGNYFETKEEAEKAVEKLKAWKRLKDKGFRFTLTPGVGSLDVTPGKFQIEINAEMPEKWFCCDAVEKDLDDCFGGEE